MRGLIAAVAALMMSMFFSLPAQALEAFVVESYDVHMRVQDDNSCLVVETWDLRFTAKRHGLILSIPLRTYSGRPMELSGVSVDGRPFSSSREGGQLNVRIGDPNSWAAERERYVLRYRLTIGDDGRRDMDELYYNLIGGDIDAPIRQMTFTIEMPHAFDQSRLNFTHGMRGSTDNSAAQCAVEGKVITGRLLVENQPGQMLTVALPLPEGYFSSVERRLDPGTLIRDYYWIWMPFMALLGLLFWKLALKNRQIFPTVEFYPPPGLTSADIGYIIDGRVDPFDVTSLLVYWADRGYLSITETSEKKLFGTRRGFILQKLKEVGLESKPYERVMFQDLFLRFARADGLVYTADLEQSRFYATVDKVKKLLGDSFKNEPEARIYEPGHGLRVMLARLPAFGCLWLAAFILLDRTGQDSFSATALAAAGMALVLTILLGEFAGFLSRWKTAPRQGRVKKLLTLGFSAAALAGAALWAGAVHRLLPPVLLGLAAAAVPLALSCSGGRRTEPGNRAMERLLGFRGFLEAAEKDRINMLVEENPQYFYKVLPYAMVLGVTDKWARGFEQIAVPPPNWYRSNQWGGGFQAANFASWLNAGLHGVTVSIESGRPASRSGGSSSGGSAGGGSGGTGAKSW